jgi:acyl-CoA reductase-like NAD-dependent aldehyde dehydrogenase
MKKLSAGPESEGHQLPCLFRESSAKRVLEILEAAVKDGGKLVVRDLKRSGPIIQPHLIDRYPTSNEAFIDQSFGAIITVSRVDDGIQAMIDLVNSSEYTLTNSVFGMNIEDCMTVARALRSGSAHINGPTISVLPAFKSDHRLRQIVLQVVLADQVDMDDLVAVKASMDTQI